MKNQYLNSSLMFGTKLRNFEIKQKVNKLIIKREIVEVVEISIKF